MGVVASTPKVMWARLFQPPQFRVIFVGLDGAGKTQILYRLIGKQVTTAPTQGFNLEVLECQNASVVCWDIGYTPQLACGKLQHHMNNTQGVVFVIDSSAFHRMIDARTFLQKFLRDYGEHFANTVFMVFANKQDLISEPLEQLLESLSVHKSLDGRKWFCRGGSAYTGDGIQEAFDSLVRAMSGGSVETVLKSNQYNLTVKLTRDEERGMTCIVTNMGGAEVLNIAAPPSYTVVELRDKLRMLLKTQNDQITLVSSGGHVLPAHDSTCTVHEVLDSTNLSLLGRKTWLTWRCCLRRVPLASVKKF